MNHFLAKSFLLLAVWLCVAPTSAWAVLVDATIETGFEGGFRYSLVHNATKNCTTDGLCKSGTFLLNPLSGLLRFDLEEDVTGKFTLTLQSPGSSPHMNILTSSDGTIQFTSGMIMDPGTDSGDYASGSLVYTLNETGSPSESGTFYFEAQSFSSLGQNGPNNINDTTFWFWGNNWDITNNGSSGSVNSPLGLDLSGTFSPVTPSTTVPAPSAMLLMGSALLGVALWKWRTIR